MTIDKRKAGAGAVLIAVSSVLILALSQIGTPLPLVTASVATLAMAAGALLLGTAGGGRPV